MYNTGHEKPDYPDACVGCSNNDECMMNALHVLRMLRRNYILVDVD